MSSDRSEMRVGAEGCREHLSTRSGPLTLEGTLISAVPGGLFCPNCRVPSDGGSEIWRNVLAW